eukprot:TRINITY_DN11185_c0_g1_i2.p2 TRINITY_DN11185_c0_g1~~TRINITY_DN11185_c0_g1_i2.p2  ORF type:complete len:145 (+),score=36.04 TRINITY_DN11185_c0_g1_i2:3-437(+)
MLLDVQASSAEFLFFFFSSRRRHTRSCLVSWARRCVQETDLRDLSLCQKIVKNEEFFGDNEPLIIGAQSFLEDHVKLERQKRSGYCDGTQFQITNQNFPDLNDQYKQTTSKTIQQQIQEDKQKEEEWRNGGQLMRFNYKEKKKS